MSYVLWPKWYITQICQTSITILTVNVICFQKTSISNSDSLLFYKRLLQYSVLSGLDRCCTCNFTLIESCLTMFITTIDMAPWSFFFFLINYSLSLILWRSVFEYCVFPCVHTLEDGAQVAHPVIFLANQVFLFFYCFNCNDSENFNNMIVVEKMDFLGLPQQHRERERVGVRGERFKCVCVCVRERESEREEWCVCVCSLVVCVCVFPCVQESVTYKNMTYFII